MDLNYFLNSSKTIIYCEFFLNRRYNMNCEIFFGFLILTWKYKEIFSHQSVPFFGALYSPLGIVDTISNFIFTTLLPTVPHKHLIDL